MSSAAIPPEPPAPLRVSALQLPALVELLRRAGVADAEAVVQADLAAGAPRNEDGTVHLVHYAAWLVRSLSEPST